MQDVYGLVSHGAAQAHCFDQVVQKSAPAQGSKQTELSPTSEVYVKDRSVKWELCSMGVCLLGCTAELGCLIDGIKEHTKQLSI